MKTLILDIDSICFNCRVANYQNIMLVRYVFNKVINALQRGHITCLNTCFHKKLVESLFLIIINFINRKQLITRLDNQVVIKNHQKEDQISSLLQCKIRHHLWGSREASSYKTIKVLKHDLSSQVNISSASQPVSKV